MGQPPSRARRAYKPSIFHCDSPRNLGVLADSRSFDPSRLRGLRDLAGHLRPVSDWLLSSSSPLRPPLSREPADWPDSIMVSIWMSPSAVLFTLALRLVFARVRVSAKELLLPRRSVPT